MENSDFIILDGGMGTMLQAAGLPMGYTPEFWNVEKPEIITSIQRQYVEAGSQIIYANTFGANRHKLKGRDVAEIIAAGIKCAKDACAGTSCKVALDIGPIGQLLEPLGDLSFDDAYDIYKEMVIAGAEAGADLVVFETMSDLYEVKAAVLAAKEHTSLPIYVTMTFEANWRTFVGVTIPAMALTLTGLGVDAMGFNCSLGPKELLPMIEELARWTNLPLILKPNAGLPDPATGAYTITPEEFAAELVAAVDYGVTIFGGCCGSRPDFIAATCKALEGLSSKHTIKPIPQALCSATQVARLDTVRVIGERINPTGKKRFQQALRENDLAYILERGIEQQDAGADILDVNVGLPGIDEADMMKRVVKELQSVIDLPLQIDASDVAAIETGLRYYNGKPILNSVNGKKESLEAILPLCKKYGAAVVGLAMDEGGIPQTREKRIEIAKRIVAAAESYGIPREDVYIDCLTLTVSAQQEQAIETLEAVRYVTQEMGLHTVLGVSNISFGLPQREHITVNFLAQAMAAGLDLPIINPNQRAVMGAVLAHRVLTGYDKDSEDYISRFAGVADAPMATMPGANAPKKATATADDSAMTLEQAIGRGLKEESANLTKKALETMDEMEVVNTLLIPALDLVGDRYERQEIFLPQLINAANAACEGFEVIKTRIAQKGEGSVSKGHIIIATVKGDIHDIGKNIVRVVLENYGYTVLDLGRDVDPQLIVDTAIKEDIHLIGLSALMTTTVASMKETIELLRASGHECTIWVGGAVLTPEYAAEIGADYYAKDAKQSVDIAKKFFGQG